MAEALANPFFKNTGKVSVPDHLPLPALVLYLHLEFDDDAHRGKQLTDLFYNYCGTAEGLQKLGEIIGQDKKSADCLSAALQAVERGEIEAYEKDYDFEAFERDKLKTPEFYTVSFLVWAEKTGVQIPKYIRDELETQIKYHFLTQSTRSETRWNFPAMNQEAFAQRVNEPLWKMTDALLYVLGYQSTATEEKKVGFLQYKPRAKRLRDYIIAARRTGDLKLYDFDDHLLDYDQANVEEKRIKSFYASSVKPKELVTWLNGLSLGLLMIERYVAAPVPSQPTVDTPMKAQTSDEKKRPVPFKKIWHDPVWSKVISAIIITIAGLLVTALFKRWGVQAVK